MKNINLLAQISQILVVVSVCLFSALVSQAQQPEPLASWNDGPSKQAIIQFVERVTLEGGDDFVAPEDRIAVFDNDGTLWCEKPLPFQLYFAIDEVKRLAAIDPTLLDNPALKAAVDGNFAELMAGEGHPGLVEVVKTTHTGMSTVEFTKRVENWLASAKQPRFNRAFNSLTYQPMVEVLSYLRANGFKTFIVSGGGADFMRVFSEDAYGIPPQQVVGSNSQTKYELLEGLPVLTKTLDALFVDDKTGKPVGIHQFIGRRPIACFGNSDGDQAMLQYTTIGNPKPSLGVIVKHTDAVREYAYAADAKVSGKLDTALVEAEQRGWTVVDMKQDWKTVFSSTEPPEAAGIRELSGEWLVEDIARNGVVDLSHTTIVFGDEGKVSGDTSVNRFSGAVTRDGQSLTFGRMLTTRRAGPPALMDQESKFLTALGEVRTFRFTPEGLLLLLDSAGQPVLRCAEIR